ncbi:MAG: hypothetical protein QG651_864 [Pseudomonadota bacterium]|jgi:hypothetical protein|nr:hypothetical protein [Pseudomonadota bacterium]
MLLLIAKLAALYLFSHLKTKKSVTYNKLNLLITIELMLLGVLIILYRVNLGLI